MLLCEIVDSVEYLHTILLISECFYFSFHGFGLFLNEIDVLNMSSNNNLLVM